MPYYLVNRLGDGSINNKIRPDVDPGVSYGCGYGNDNKVIVLTDVPLSSKAGRIQLPPVAQLQSACEARGIDFNAVMNKWYIRGGG